MQIRKINNHRTFESFPIFAPFQIAKINFGAAQLYHKNCASNGRWTIKRNWWQGIMDDWI